MSLAPPTAYNTKVLTDVGEQSSSRRRLASLVPRGCGGKTRALFLGLAFVLLAAPEGRAQGPAAAALVFTTPARTHQVTSAMELPGSVEPLRKTRVASPVAGLVKELLVRDGDSVENGEILARLDTDSAEARRATLRAQIVESEARLHEADSNLSRAQELFGASLISQEQLDGSRFEREALHARTQSLRAMVAEVDLAIEQSVIRAPFGGVVTQKLTEIGQWVKVGDPLIEVVGVADIEVRVDVPGIHLHKIRLGQPARVRIEALRQTTLRGTVTAVSPEADPKARTFPVKIAIPSRNGSIRAGMVASVSFAPARPRHVTIVPKDALVEQDRGWVVFVVGDDQRVSPVPVRLGEGAGAWSEVLGAIEPGDTVVTRGNERLRAGQSVTAEHQDYPLP